MLNLILSTVDPSLRNQLTFDTNDSLIKDVMIDDFPTPSKISAHATSSGVAIQHTIPHNNYSDQVASRHFVVVLSSCLLTVRLIWNF